MNGPPTWKDQECRVSVIAGDVTLMGTLGVPASASGIVLFAHGQGSSRHCPHNRCVARLLRQEKWATLLLDLLTRAEEASTREGQLPEFDRERFVGRLVGATHWLRQNPLTQHLNLGYFGVGSGGRAALEAAARCPDAVSAIVCQGGLPEAIAATASQVTAPTLLIVGGNDPTAIAANRAILKQLKAARELEIVPGASHNFEEPGTTEKVASLASQWFELHLLGRSLLAAGG